MLYYVIPYLFLVVFSIILYYLRLDDSHRKFIFFLLVLPGTSLAVLRGNVGTDTLHYLNDFSELIKGADIQSEPGFKLLAHGINLIGFNERFGVAFISCLTSIILIKSFSKNKQQMVLFSLVLFPIFFYDMTMNGLRYGLGFAITSVAVDYLYKKENLAFILLGLVAISIQYSSLFIILVFLIFKLDKKYLIGLLLLMVPAAFLLTFDFTYFYAKQDAYKDLVSPAATSGLGPLILFLMLFVGFLFYSGKKGATNIMILILVLELGSFMLAKVTYAGLRFQSVFLFSLILLIKQEYHFITKNNEFLLLLLFIGFIGFMFTTKNLGAVSEDVESPFIPYKFFFQ